MMSRKPDWTGLFGQQIPYRTPFISLLTPSNGRVFVWLPHGPIAVHFDVNVYFRPDNLTGTNSHGEGGSGRSMGRRTKE